MTKKPDCQPIDLLWGAWYEEAAMQLDFPSHWEIQKCSIVDSPRMTSQKISDAVTEPINNLSLQRLAQGKKNVVIAVEDITRPSRLERILRYVLKELYSAGLDKKQISFVICNGAHAPMLRVDLEKKFGPEILRDFLILNHNPYDNLEDSGIMLGKTPFKVNRNYLQADLKIAIGTIIPHSFAGFSAGGKLILPGLADIGTLERTHKFVMMGMRGGVNNVETNKFRHEVEKVVGQVGCDFFIGVVPNSRREIAGVFAGHFVDAHRAGVEFGRKIYKTRVSPADVVVLNAYPKDSELIQADTALTPLKTTTADFISEDGVVIIISRSSNGLGHHSLFGPGMRLYRKPIKRRFLKDRELIIYSPNVNQAEFETIFWDGYTFATQWQDVLENLYKRFPQKCRVAILPTAPFQLLECDT